jgi:hypothetical protein
MSVWRWFDRGARVDFVGTLLGLIFDWRTWLAGIFSGGGMTFLWAAIEGWSPLQVYLMAIFASACFVIIIAGVVAAVKTIRRAAFEIVYDQNDPNCVQPIANSATRFSVQLHMLAKHSIDGPNVRAQENEFTVRMFADRHREVTGKPYVSGPLQLYIDLSSRGQWPIELQYFERPCGSQPHDES